MKKAIHHIILLSLLLLISNSSLFALTLPTTSCYKSSFDVKTAIDRKSTHRIACLFGNKSSVSDTLFEKYVKKEILSSDSEEEDTENMSSKKAVDKTSVLLSDFKLQTTQTSLSYFRKPLAVFKNQLFLPTRNSLYIIFEVFRI